MTLTIIVIIVIGLVLGAALAVRIVATAMGSRPATPAAAEQPQTPQQMPQVLELRQDSGADASAPGPAASAPAAETGQPAVVAPPAATAPSAAGHTVVFDATGVNGATSAGNVTYSVNYAIKQERGVPLPYGKEVTVDAVPHLYLWVQNAGAAGEVTCRIKVDGKVVREAVGRGPYGVCTVTVSGP